MTRMKPKPQNRVAVIEVIESQLTLTGDDQVEHESLLFSIVSQTHHTVASAVETIELLKSDGALDIEDGKYRLNRENLPNQLK